MADKSYLVDAEELARIYSLRFEKNLEYRNRVWAILTAEFFQRWIPREASVLDLGCGYGEFINNIDAREKIAIDMNANAKTHLDPDVRFVEQDCSERWPFADGCLDVVFTSNFFEHLPNKQALAATVLQAHRCLKAGGLLMAVGPNIRCLPGSYWDFWDHHIALSELSISEALEVWDFRIEYCKDRFLPYTMSRRRNVPLRLVSLYLHLPIFWKVLGKQFLVIASKKTPASKSRA